MLVSAVNPFIGGCPMSTCFAFLLMPSNIKKYHLSIRHVQLVQYLNTFSTKNYVIRNSVFQVNVPRSTFGFHVITKDTLSLSPRRRRILTTSISRQLIQDWKRNTMSYALDGQKILRKLANHVEHLPKINIRYFEIKI